MSYELSYSDKASKQLAKLDRSIKIQLMKKFGELEQNPLLGKPLGNILKNQRSLHVGKFRAVYFIKEQKILITKIKHRKKAYEG